MTKANKNNQESWLSIGEAAKYLRISKDTLRRWEKKRILKTHRSPTNRRFYRKEDLERIFSKKEEVKQKNEVIPQAKGNLPSLIIIGLFTTFIIIAAFLAWLLLTT